MTVRPYTKVLCQNCLKIKPFTEERHLGAEQCECGGDFCGCEQCTDGMNALLSGKRKAEEVGTVGDVPASWTAKNGIKEAHHA